MRRNIHIQWACEARVDSLSNDIVQSMKEAGCCGIYLGVESGSQRMLDLIQKGITVDQIREASSICRRHGIRTYCSLIVGLPGETYDDYLATQTLMNEIRPFSYNFSVFVGIPGSPLYTQIIKQGLYEYIDDLGLVYLPGFDMKCKFFYGKPASAYVDYTFTRLTDYDRMLAMHLPKRRLRFAIKNAAKTVFPQTTRHLIKRLLYPRY